MARDSDLPHWVGDLPDPKRPPWVGLPLWQRGIVLLIMLVAGLGILAAALSVLAAGAGAFVRIFRWAAWGMGCGA